MKKHFVIATLYSIIVFAVVSYVSVMISLLSSVGDPSLKPITNIGFPYKYYYQFWMRGSDSPNCGWVINSFILDCFLTWIFVALIYLGWKKFKL